MFPNAKYMNCDLPSVQRQLEDPEFFYQNTGEKEIVIFDEVHRLTNPSELLKIGVDEYPNLKILATGSSTLSATSKFKDSLTCRKIQIFLPPILWFECETTFNNSNLMHRLYNGGLPEFFFCEKVDKSLFSEWIDSFYARDIQELFGIRNRTGFLKLLYLIIMQSGGVFETTKLSKESAVSRPTVMSHIDALTLAHAINIVPPFSGGGKGEIVKRPKIYAFDTGFVCYVNGWGELRPDDIRLLWEHLVHDMLKAKYGTVYYWIDRFQNEIDFVIRGDEKNIHTFECKINPNKFNPKSLLQFRSFYPIGNNYCFVPNLKEPYKKRISGLVVEFISHIA